jgi:L-threonylcarbamoyladenylate synthase
LAKIRPIVEANAEALALLAAGEPVALPTETVYGLAADATRGATVARIFEVKGRPRFNPLIAHVADMEMARKIAEFSSLAEKTAALFWPGPLTIVLKLAEESPVHELVTAGLPTVALRMPRGPARDLIAAFGRPLAAPSANLSGRISPTSAQAVADDLGERIALVLDGGPTAVGLESTIIRIDGAGVTLLRPGGLTVEELEQGLDVPVRRETGSAIQAPGMMASHYAPAAHMRLNAERVEPGEALLAFGPTRIAGADEARAIANLSSAGSVREAAANLFAQMRTLDASGAGTIAVEPIPVEGLGEAINDRLARAAAPRDK